MATSRSIGSLFIDIEARTAKMEADLARVKNILTDTGKAVKQNGVIFGETATAIEGKIGRFAIGMLGARTMVQLLSKDVRDVAMNIEKIPGLPAHVTKSIQEFRHDLLGAQQDIRVGIAYTEMWFATLSKALGAGIGVFTNLLEGRSGNQAIFDQVVGGAQDLTPDQLAHDRDPEGYEDKVARAKEVLAERTAASARAAMDEAHQILSLRGEMTRLGLVVKDVTKDTLEQTEAAIKVEHLHAEEGGKLEGIQKRLLAAQEAVTHSLEKGAVATVSTRERVSIYRDKVQELRGALTALSGAIDVAPDDPILLVKRVKLTEELAFAQRGLNDAMAKYGEIGAQMGKAVANDLQEAILKGEGLHELLGKLLEDMLRIILQREIFAPLADFMSGGFTSFFNIGKSAAGGPIGAGPRLVGEFGPEVFNPGGAGTIIPNDKLGGGSGGNTYYIDATGADSAAISRLEQALLTLAGPGVVERRALGATLNASWRGGGTGRALRMG